MKTAFKVLLAILFFGFLPFSIASAPTAQAQSTTPIAVATSTLVVVPATTDPVASNCYSYVKSRIPSLPLTKDIIGNTSPKVGSVAIFQYGDLPHYAIVTQMNEKGFWVIDSNFGGPGIRNHFIEWSNIHTRGFWVPSDTS